MKQRMIFTKSPQFRRIKSCTFYTTFKKQIIIV
jgi:hypothetical protein